MDYMFFVLPNSIIFNKINKKTKQFHSFRIYCTIISLCLVFSKIHAQETIITSGGDVSGTGGALAYSIGQIFNTAYVTTSGSINQGIQNPYEIYALNIEENEINAPGIIFPNPTSDNIILEMENVNNEKIIYQLFDMKGKLLENNQITESTTQINMKLLISAAYFLHVIQGDRKIQSFKIVKNL